MITAYQINSLDDVTAPYSSLLSGYMEWEVPLGPVSGGYINKRLRGDRLAAWLQGLSAQTGPNRRPGAIKYARYLTAAQSGTTGDTYLLQYTEDVLVLNQTGVVEFSPDRPGRQDYRLVYDGAPRTAPGLRAFQTGECVPGNFVPVRWALVDSPEAANPTWTQLQTNPPTPSYNFPIGFVVRSYAGTTTEYFFKAKIAGVLAAPTAANGDANWERISRDDVPASGITRAELEVVRTRAQLSALKAADYTLVLADAGNIVPFTAAAICTIPVNVFPVGTVLEIAQDGTGVVTLAPASGVTIRTATGLKTAGQWTSVGLRQRDVNEWVLTNAVL